MSGDASVQSPYIIEDEEKPDNVGEQRPTAEEILQSSFTAVSLLYTRITKGENDEEINKPTSIVHIYKRLQEKT